MSDATLELLQRWNRGDRGALEELLLRDLPWIKDRVSRRLGDLLRQRAETEDYLQDALLEVLRYTPRFLVADASAFRRLLARIVENLLRDRHEHFARRRREAARESPLAEDTVLCLDARVKTATTPSQAAARDEEEAWLRLALELLDPEDRDVIVLRQYDGLAFAEVAERFGIAENAARMRFQRALRRLARKVEQLRSGEL